MPTVVSIVPAPPSLTEGSNGVFSLVRDDNSAPLFVNVSISGTATGSGTDYTLGSTPVFFPPGAWSVELSVSTTNDSTSEPTETIIATLATGTGYTIGSPSSATMDILDNDAQYVSVATDDGLEDGTDDGHFVFSRIGDLTSSLTVNFSVSGTATSGTDYTSIGTSVTFSAGSATASKTVTALADNVVEGDEYATVTITSGSGYSIGSPYSGSSHITDDPPVISVEATEAYQTSSTGGFTFTRTGGDLSSSLTVDYTVSGTATSGTDYTALSGSVTFEADVEHVDVPVDVLVPDGGTTVIAEIDDGGTDYAIDGDAYSATVNIVDQPLTVSVERLTDGEEGSGNASFRFIRYGDTSASLTVDYTVSGTAVSGTDFTALSGSVTFAAYSDHTDVTVYVTNDGSGENTETVTVTLDESDDYVLANDSDTVLITDNDVRRVVWTGAVNGHWDVPGNWTTVGNSSEHEVPGSTDEVYFDHNVSDNDCTDLGDGEGSLTLRGVHFVNGYAGTVTLAAPLSVSTYVQTAGTLDQPDEDYGLTVTKAMLWTGGTLNSTDYLATVTITGSTTVARFAPAGEGTVYLGSNITLNDGAVVTMKAGTVEATNAVEFNIDENCGMKADPEPEGSVEWKGFDITDQTIFKLIKATSYFTLNSGSFATKAYMWNLLGTVTLWPGTEAYFNKNGDNAFGYYSEAKLIMWYDSKLKSEKDIKIVGGDLVTVGEFREACNVEIQCATLWLDQSTIRLARYEGDFAAHQYDTFGKLSTIASVDWYNATLQVYVPAEHNGALGDWWRSGGLLRAGPNLAGNATVPKLRVFAFDDENNVVAPTSGYQWKVIQSGDEIKKVNPNAPDLDTDVWELVEDPPNAAQKRQWFVKAK